RRSEPQSCPFPVMKTPRGVPRGRQQYPSRYERDRISLAPRLREFIRARESRGTAPLALMLVRQRRLVLCTAAEVYTPWVAPLGRPFNAHRNAASARMPRPP